MGTATIGDGALDQLSKAMLGFGHPVRARCLILLGDEHSPSELWELLNPGVRDRPDDKGTPALGVISYHVRMLRDYGLVRVTRTEPARGALEHFYRRTELAEVVFEAIAPLYGVPRRGARMAKAA